MIQVEGREPKSLAVFKQQKDAGTAKMQKNMALNTYMHNRLVEEYLWEDYGTLEVDLTMEYTEFLNKHLLMLGNVNIEDGGKYRSGENKGKRFIYSNIQEVAPVTKTYETGGLGFGPIFSSRIDAQNDVMGLSIAYVHQGSPAWAAGMKRGDTIYSVNGVVLTSSNYKNYMNALYYSPSGTYRLAFIRNADMNERYEVQVTTDVYRYNPVLYSAIYGEGEHKIGYLVLENFDLEAQDFVADIIQQFKDNSITDLILDLRFNPGGAVAQSRYLASAIAGAAHLDDTFVQVEFRGNKRQTWKFRGGPNDQDGLGIAPDLGLERLYVIGSENTASASELIINGLKGIDFPVYLYGSQTEGKNVGMTTTQTTYEGSRYLFSPITFRVTNAKGFGDYPDGFRPDVMVNNQNSSYADDIDNTFPYSFGDWGDMGFNKALYLAYQDIVGSPAASSIPCSVPDFSPIPMGGSGLKQPAHGRYGNVIYLE
jgi:C-terminal processing protease CtpA/Prc